MGYYFCKIRIANKSGVSFSFKALKWPSETITVKEDLCPYLWVYFICALTKSNIIYCCDILLNGARIIAQKYYNIYTATVKSLKWNIGGLLSKTNLLTSLLLMYLLYFDNKYLKSIALATVTRNISHHYVFE